MADFTNINQVIDQYITTNAQGDITGQILNEVLEAMLGAVGEILDNKVNTEQGKGLSTNDFTTALKNKLNAMPNITAYDATNDQITIGGKVYQLTPYVPIADYYVGWATGASASFDGFAALNASSLSSLSTAYFKTSQSSVTKNVTSAMAVGDRQIFFLMWREGSAPQSGSMTSGGFTEQLTASDFTNSDVFNATHDNVILNGVTYHVAGMRGAFGVGDSFTINF